MKPLAAGLDARNARRIPLNGVEALLGGLLIVALWRLLALTHQQGELVDHAQEVVHQRDSLSVIVRQSRLETQYLRQLASASQIDLDAPIVATDTDGDSVAILLQELLHPILFYTLDIRCPTCIANIPVMNRLQSRSICGVEVIGVLVSDWELFSEWRVEQPMPLAFKLLRNPSRAIWDILPINVTPSVVLVGPGGKMSGWWLGDLRTNGEQMIAEEMRALC